MRLCREALESLRSSKANVPSSTVFENPEKVLQFGTSAFLRGLPDYYIDKANKKGIFNGRIVMVDVAGNNLSEAFARQEALFTHCIRGITKGKKVEENIINTSVSRVLSAETQWQEILECASNPDMEIVISNTTEAGISLLADDDINSSPPVSYPGKLLAFLYKRFQAFNADASKGMVIVPTEHIAENGSRLEDIVCELAHINDLDPLFLDWLEDACCFCTSLADRIVSETVPVNEKDKVENNLGYTDELMVMSETYGLWAIKAPSEIARQKLSFAKADKGVIIASNINKFKELKLRLLNGTHTFSCALALLAGFSTVKEAMDNAAISAFIQNLMVQEITPAIAHSTLTIDEANNFCDDVLDRIRNQYIQHNWATISMNFSAKMKKRNVPVLLQHYYKTGLVPEHMALGFAAYILFMKSEARDGKFYKEINGVKYEVADVHAAWYFNRWKQYSGLELVQVVLSDTDFWDTDLTELNGFKEAVAENLELLQTHNVLDVINRMHSPKVLI